MFSADAPSHTHSLRSKRTRQTTTGDDSVKLPATKKRRSALRRDTFEPLTESSLNEIAGREKPAEKQNGHAVEPSTHSGNTSQSRELTLRGGKKLEKRTERGGGLLTLSTNDYYTVSQLPALPEQIRSRPGVPYSCDISPENDYILALTHTDALCWSYTVSASTPSSRELLSFKLPFPPANSNDPLPLATFTAKSANGEPGIIAISPRWGKIVYWESLTSASTYVPGQTTSGLQGSIPGMLNGEVVKELVSAEPAGFIVTFSHGRVAQITVRDQLGRPNIGIQWLRKSSANTVRGGFFGSIRNILTNDRRKGTPLVRAGKSAKAQREVIVCSEEGEIEFWTNNLSIGNSLTKALSVQEQLQEALQNHVQDAQSNPTLRFRILDFSLSATPTSAHELAKRGHKDDTSFIFLISVAGAQETRYFVVESVVVGELVNVKVVHHIRCFSTDARNTSDWRPSLCMSNPQAPAFVILERAVVLMSLARITETPSSQLLGSRAALPEPFQDCITFQDDTIYKIINYAGEVHDNAVACVFAVQGFGLVRITSHLQNTEEVDVEDVESGVSAKSRIEQAIFFGTKKSNPLELKKRTNEPYDPEQIRLATVQISQEILSSKCKYLPKSSSSIDDHLKQRARALQDLAEHVLRYYPNCIPRDVRFWLLWQAEKLAAAQALWKVQQSIQQTYPHKDDREMTYLNFVLRALHESRQKYPKPEKGETDHVRHWLIHSVYSIDHLLTELESCLQDLPHMDINDPRIICDYLAEALDLWIAAYRAAFKFREDNASIYGLGDDVYQNGVLTSGYPPDLQPWTSSKEPLRFAQDLIADVCRFLQDWWDYNPSATTNGTSTAKSNKSKQIPRDVEGNVYDAPSKESLHDLAGRLPDLVELFNRILKENNIQDQNRLKTSADVDPDDKEQQLKQLKHDIKPIIKQAITWIAPFNREGSISLAEELADTELLVDLNLSYLADIAREAQAHPEKANSLQRQVHDIQEHVETYFDRFGNSWAYAHFSSLIERGEVGRMLAEAQAEKGKKQPYLSWFLDRSAAQTQQLGKVSWINDVIGEGDFTRARTTLESVADTEETDIWSRKTEVCLAKLAGLAASEEASTSTSRPSKQKEAHIAAYDTQLQYLEVQEALSTHVNGALADAIDAQAAFDLALETFIPKPTLTTKKASNQRKYLTSLLSKIIQDQVLSLSELVDALTILQLGEFRGDISLVDDPMVTDQEFALALRAVELQTEANMSEHDKSVLVNSIWRRLLIRDDWMKLNDTSGKSDEEVKLTMAQTMLMKTLLALFDTASKTDSTVHIPSIDDLLKGSPNSAPAEGDNDAEESNEKVSEETKAEIKLLKNYVDKARLSEHFSGLAKEAQRAVRDFRDQEGEHLQQQLAAMEDDSIMQSVEEDGPS